MSNITSYPNGLCASVSAHHPGSTHDFSICKDNLPMYRSLLTKQKNEEHLEDDGELAEQYPNLWAMVGDSAYTGGAKHKVRLMHIKKQSQQKAEERDHFKSLGRDRVLAENFYGRMLGMFKIMRDTYVYDHQNYDELFSVCASLTNYSILANPLRNEEGTYYRNAVVDFVNEGKQREKKRKRQQEKYSKKIAVAKKRAREEEEDVTRNVRQKS